MKVVTAFLPSAMVALVLIAQPAASQTKRDITRAVEEITVTAQKREENLQDVPISVSAVNAEQIEKTFARDIQELVSISPNLIIDPILGSGTAAISIRGMQLNDVERSFDPAVAVYLDGIYLANTSGALLNVWDAEAVEVLRGPQGTLFGRNTIGGLVHVKRTRPKGEWSGKLDATLGSYDQFDLKGVLHFPAVANDTLSNKVSFISLDGGGYFDNLVRPAQEGDADVWGITFTTLYEPNDALDFLLTYEHHEDDSMTRPVTSLSDASQFFGLAPVLGWVGAPKTDEDFHRDTRTTSRQESFLETDAVTFEATWDVTDAHQLVLLTGWRETDERAEQEFDGVTADLFRTVRPQQDEQFSVEFRWHSDWNDDVKTVLGAYYWDSEYQLQQSTTSFAFFGVPMNIGDVVSSDPTFDHTTESYAVFGQVDWTFMDHVTLSVGGRWIHEEKTGCGTQNFNLLGIGSTLIRSYGDCPGNVRVPGVYQPTAVDPRSGRVLPRPGTESWEEFTPRVGLSYQFDNGNLLYFTYSEGFRSGGFNGRSTDSLTLGPYDPESVETYEFGLKSTWWDDRLQFNIAGFLTTYDEKQEDVVFADPVQVTVTIVENAASADIDGVEAELVVVPVDGLTLSANIGYLDASYEEWFVFDNTTPGCSPPPVPNPLCRVDKSSLELRRAPEFTFALNGLYEVPLGPGVLILGANYSYRDDYHITANNVVVGPEDGYGLLDASINYELDNWRISVWGKNLLDEDYFLHALDVGSNFLATSPTDPTPVLVPPLWTFGTINPPATGGITVQYRF